MVVASQGHYQTFSFASELDRQEMLCVVACRPDTPDVSSDLTPRIVSSSGRSSSMLGSESTDAVPAASSPCSSSHSLQGPPAEPPTSSAPTPFAAAALMRASFTDLSEAESEFSSTPRSSIDGQEPRHASAHAASTRTARAVPKSPKSPSRAHVQQPLDESEGMKPVLAKLGMLERTHSAPGTLPASFKSRKTYKG